jgi:threonine dehydrogenase-like Zn-dependent dehydrogenase
MQALRAETVDSPFTLRTIPIPDVGPQDVLIKVASAGITPGVVKLLKRGLSRVPSTLGHEGAGTVTAVGSEVPNLMIGDRVRLHATLSCRKCSYCKSLKEQMCGDAALIGFARFGKESELYNRYHDGTVAEYVRAPYWLVDILPENVSFDTGAKIHDIATALGVLKQANLASESTIILTGATGAMGSITLRLLSFFPVKRVIILGRSKERLETARSLTSIPTEVFVLPREQQEIAIGAFPLAAQLKAMAPEGIDSLIDYLPSGNILSQILPALRVGGTLVHIGGNESPLLLPLVFIMQNCWKITGGRANTREDVVQVLKWLKEGSLDIEDLFTHRFSLFDYQRAVDMLQSRAETGWLSVINVNS